MCSQFFFSSYMDLQCILTTLIEIARWCPDPCKIFLPKASSEIAQDLLCLLSTVWCSHWISILCKICFLPVAFKQSDQLDIIKAQFCYLLLHTNISNAPRTPKDLLMDVAEHIVTICQHLRHFPQNHENCIIAFIFDGSGGPNQSVKRLATKDSIHHKDRSISCIRKMRNLVHLFQTLWITWLLFELIKLSCHYIIDLGYTALCNLQK